MSSPSPSSLIANLRPDIAGALTAFDLEANNQRMIALRVFPVIETALQAGPFGKITLESLMKSVDTKRASGGGYNSTNFEFTTDSYATNENGIEVPVDKRNAAIYANYFDAEMVAAKLARSKVMVNLESRVAGKVFNASTFTPTAVGTEWSVAASATPITDVEAAIRRLYAKGIIANALVISWTVFRNLRNSAQIIDRITSAGAGAPAKPSDITTQMLATVFDLENIIVGGSQISSTTEGQTVTMAGIWSNEYAFVTRIAGQGASIEEPCIGRTFHWGEDGSNIGGAVETYYDNGKRADVVRCRMDSDEKLLYSAAGELLSNITA